MMLKPVQGPAERKLFHALPHGIYETNAFHRDTEESITRLLVDGPTVYHTNATVSPFLLFEGTEIVGRCAFIHDRRLPEYLQVAFFEALPGLSGISEVLAETGQSLGSCATRLVIGLNGHLNYGAGFLLDHFTEPPVFGLPYTPEYYPAYFSGCRCRRMVSYRFPLKGIYDWVRSVKNTFDARGVEVRFFRKNDLRREIELYTYIDNATFSNAECPYWYNREAEENYELFHPFRFLIRPEHLLFAHKNGKPVGFLLWYPDFNMVVPPGRDIGVVDVLRYRFLSRPNAIRLAEIAILPEYRNTPAVAALYRLSLPELERTGYETCEGGFIFDENRSSKVMTERYIERGCGERKGPYRSYGIFEREL